MSLSDHLADTISASTQTASFGVVGATLAGITVEAWMMGGSAVLLILNVVYVSWRLYRLSKEK